MIWLALAAVAAEPVAEVDGDGVVYWAGRFATGGERRVPVLGAVKYTSEARTLSEVRRLPDGGLQLTQRTCEVALGKTAGARLEMNEQGPGAMPASTLRFHVDDAGTWTAEPWPSGWGEGDLDEDGEPGLTIHVHAPLCGGALMVASDARTTATNLTPDGDALSGEVAIWTRQTVLDARGLCLSMFSRSSEETMRGRFRYEPVTATTCAEIDWSAVPEVPPPAIETD